LPHLPHPKAAQVLCGFRAPRPTKKANSINAISVAVS
jgi:hypothetical protein